MTETVDTATASAELVVGQHARPARRARDRWATTASSSPRCCAKTGQGHRRPGLHEHRVVRVDDHLHRRRRGHPALPRLPDRAAGRAAPRSSRSPTCSSTASCPRRRPARRVRASASTATRSCTRTSRPFIGDVPAQRAPDGRAVVGDRRRCPRTTPRRSTRSTRTTVELATVLLLAKTPTIVAYVAPSVHGRSRCSTRTSGAGTSRTSCG